MTDAVSAASLLLAMIALIFGAWWPRLTHAADFSFARSKDNRKEERGPIRAILWGQAVPLTVAAGLAAFTFMPRAAGLTGAAFGCGCFSIDRLNDVAAAFVISEILLCLIAVALVVQLVRIARNLGGSWS